MARIAKAIGTWITTAVPRIAFVISLAVATMEPAHSATCVSDAELETAVGEQIRSGAFSVNTAGLRDAPLCSGLSVAEGIQRLSSRLRADVSSPPPQPHVREDPGAANAQRSAIDRQGATAAFRASQLIGAWVARGEHCDGDVGIIYEPNGEWGTGSEGGTWSLSGRTLVMNTLEENDAGRTVKLRPPRRDVSTIVTINDREIHQRLDDGSALVLVKCVDEEGSAAQLSSAPATQMSTSAQPSGAVAASTAGGARPGMVYAEVRRKLIAAGFKPEPRPKGQLCGYSSNCDLLETDACSGTGDDQCSYNFSKGAVRIYVTGIGGVQGKAQSQKVTEINYW